MFLFFSLLASLIFTAASTPTPASAQGTQQQPPPTIIRITPPPQPGRVTPRPILVNAIDEASLSQHPVPPLTPEQEQKLTQARVQRDAQLLDKAREILTVLNAEVPHHAVVLTELARVRLARQEWPAVEQLGRTERAHANDSLLLAPEYTLALERLGKLGPAARVVTEAWCVDPGLDDWARANLSRFAAADPRGTREALRPAIARRPRRVDLAMALAETEWRAGDLAAALRVLATADTHKEGSSTRLEFGEGLISRANGRDSSAAIETFVHLAADAARPVPMRMLAAHRSWDLMKARGESATGAAAIAKALGDIPTGQWTPELVAGVARGLRQSGRTAESRALLSGLGARGLAPELALEQTLADLRDGPPERALAGLEKLSDTSAEARFTFAEALFFAGLADSALAVYKVVVEDPASPFTGAAFERIYLIEESQKHDGLRSFGQIAYQNWRGEPKQASAVAESLYRSLPQGPLWAQVALVVAGQRAAGGEPRTALQPLLAVADSLPQDRLAPLARQRAGDLYLEKLNDPAHAAAQYEECLARYPRAWNAPEIRRKLSALRQERRF